LLSLKRKQRKKLQVMFFLSLLVQSVIDWMSVDDFFDMNDLCVSMRVYVCPI
jgi:hypothetical protein